MTFGISTNILVFVWFFACDSENDNLIIANVLYCIFIFNGTQLEHYKNNKLH